MAKILGNTQKFNGKVIMSRYTGGDKNGGTGMHITIEDDLSGCRLATIDMSLEEFARALTASYGSAEVEYYPRAPIGKTSEHKTEFVKLDWGWRPADKIKTESYIDTILLPFEVDGWKAERSDLSNHHRWVKDKDGNEGYSVGFRRFV